MSRLEINFGGDTVVVLEKADSITFHRSPDGHVDVSCRAAEQFDGLEDQ